MNILNKLLGEGHDFMANHSPAPVRQGMSILQQLEQLPVVAAKAANRSTPWGQANQAAFNAAHPAPSILPAVRPLPYTANRMQLQYSPDVQGVQNPGYTPLQALHSFTSQTQGQLPYGQAGTTGYRIQ